MYIEIESAGSTNRKKEGNHKTDNERDIQERYVLFYAPTPTTRAQVCEGIYSVDK